MTIWIIAGFIFGVWLLLITTLKLIDNIKSKRLDLINARHRENESKFHENIRLERISNEEKQRELELRLNNRYTKYKEEVKLSLETLLQEKSQGFPWLATAIADYYENYDKIFAKYLASKSRPAIVQSEKIKEIALEKKHFKKEFLTTKYIINYYESLFPWLRDYVGFNSDELIQSIYTENSSTESDPVTFYVTQSEFQNLSVSERNQKALERYWNRKKDPWQIGRDYERYIGHKYEINSFKVEYHGIEKLKGDLGRDLICTNGKEIEIIQCKYWSAQKGIPIRENHITQLYGTTIKYFLEHNNINNKIQLSLFPDLLKKSNIIPVLITTGDLSTTAKEFANMLGIRVDKIPMDNNYPCIKCNINFKTNERIYHLPFDQQYDNTMINIAKGEHWVRTVKEAENLGFRRAWRWTPAKE
jgi:hypothetical protein